MRTLQSESFDFGFERERAEAGEFCKSRRLEAQLGIAVKRERPRQVPPKTPL